MNIKQLKLFHEVMVTGKTSDAAQRLSFSQPAASKMLASMESTLGYKLFLRCNGRLMPTPEAAFLHEETQSVLQSMLRLDESFERAKHGQLGKLTIASIFGPSHRFLPQIMSLYGKHHQQLKLSLQVFNSGPICDGVASGQFELGLVDYLYSPSRYVQQAFALPCFCAIHQDHPAAAEQVLSPALLNAVPWVTFSGQTHLYQTLKQHYLDQQADFNPCIEVNASFNALAFVEQNCGVTLIDAVNLQYFRAFSPKSNLVFREFTPYITEPLHLITTTARPLSKPADEIKQQITAALKALISDMY